MVRCVIKKNDRQNDEKLAKQNREKEYLKMQHYQAKLKVKQTEEKVISNHIDNAKKKKIQFLCDWNSTGLHTLFRKGIGVSLSKSSYFTETEIPLVKTTSWLREMCHEWALGWKQ